MKYIYICELHYEEKFLNRNENRVRLISKMHPLPTIFPETIKKTSLLPSLTAPRKPPVERNVMQCETETDAYMMLALKSFSDINELEVLKVLGYDWACRRSARQIMSYKMQINETASLTSVNAYTH